MAWDVTVLGTYAESHIDQTAREACSAANKAAADKIVKYGALSASHLFASRHLEPVRLRHCAGGPKNIESNFSTFVFWFVIIHLFS